MYLYRNRYQNRDDEMTYYLHLRGTSNLELVLWTGLGNI